VFEYYLIIGSGFGNCEEEVRAIQYQDRQVN